MSNLIVGLDFGTSKTAMAFAQTINLPIVDYTVPSCLLRDTPNSSARINIGSTTELEYQLSRPGQRQPQSEFFSNFKPDIRRSARHREVALQFLKELRRTKRVSELLAHHAEDSVVAVGCPVSWASGGVDTLLKLLREAGFPSAFAIPEPVAVAFSFLGHHLNAQDFRNDIVVFDWGASKFDMTVLRAGRLEFKTANSWSSAIYGGRLFDDLFYQWLLDIAKMDDRHAALQRLASEPTYRAVLRGLTCSEIKEEFSRAYGNQSLDRPWTWVLPLILGSGDNAINLGNFAVGRMGELEERMRSYKASDVMRDSLDIANVPVLAWESEFVTALREGRSVDLKAWAWRLIETGLQRLKPDNGAIACLAGGSCRWTWFSDHIRRISPFAGRKTSVISDDRPELIIARGLARAYAAGDDNQRLVTELEAKREVVVHTLQSLHSEYLEHLSHSLVAQTRHDESLKSDLNAIFKDGLQRSGVDRVDSLKGKLGRFFQIFRTNPTGAADRFLSHKEGTEVEAIRPDLEIRINRWLNENRDQVDREMARVSIETNRHVMEILRARFHTEVGGLTKVMIEAVGLGEQTSAQALQALGGKLRISSHDLARICRVDNPLMSHALPGREATSGDVPPLEKEARASTERFLAAMPAAMRESINANQSADYWARQVIDELVKSLRAPLAVVLAANEYDGLSGSSDQSALALAKRMDEHRDDAGQESNPAAQSAATSDPVNCSVFAPARPERGRRILVQAILHRADQIAGAIKAALEVDPTANRKAFSKLLVPIKRGAAVQLFLEAPTLEITIPFQEMTWNGEPLRIAYPVAIPPTTPLGVCRGTLHVMVEGAPVGEIAFELDIKKEIQAKPRTSDETDTKLQLSSVMQQVELDDDQATDPVAVEALRFRRAFISYSRKDVRQVLMYAEALEDCGVELLFDLTSIEPGVEWANKLDQMISHADVFYLMWSKNAAQSEWVDKETRGALARYESNPNHMPRIRPVVVEQPAPKPPDYLSRFQFNSKWLALRTAMNVPLFSQTNDSA